MTPAVSCTPLPSLPLLTVPRLSAHRATPTPNHRDSELGQLEAGVGGGTSEVQPQLQANPLRASLLLSGPQFTCLEIRDGGKLIFRGLPILTVSPAYLYSLTGLFHENLLSACCVPSPKLGPLLFSRLKGPSSFLVSKSQLPEGSLP